jgi:hypothetical protein
MADHRSFPVPKVQEAKAKVAPPRGGQTDITMRSPPPVGPARGMKADSEHHQREFSAERDFATLLAESKIRANAGRYGAAVAAGKGMRAASAAKDRAANITISDAGGSLGASQRRKGTTALRGAGSAGSNQYDNVRLKNAGTTGSKDDGGKGRW